MVSFDSCSRLQTVLAWRGAEWREAGTKIEMVSWSDLLIFHLHPQQHNLVFTIFLSMLKSGCSWRAKVQYTVITGLPLTHPINICRTLTDWLIYLCISYKGIVFMYIPVFLCTTPLPYCEKFKMYLCWVETNWTWHPLPNISRTLHWIVMRGEIHSPQHKFSVIHFS